MRPRLADGSFKKEFDPLNTHGQGFIEGNSWNFSFFVPQNPNGLIEVARDLTEVESNGLETNNTIQTTHIINTLYDIDQVFGGS